MFFLNQYKALILNQSKSFFIQNKSCSFKTSVNITTTFSWKVWQKTSQVKKQLFSTDCYLLLLFTVTLIITVELPLKPACQISWMGRAVHLAGGFADVQRLKCLLSCARASQWVPSGPGGGQWSTGAQSWRSAVDLSVKVDPWPWAGAAGTQNPAAPFSLSSLHPPSVEHCCLRTVCMHYLFSLLLVLLNQSFSSSILSGVSASSVLLHLTDATVAVCLPEARFRMWLAPS